MDKRTLRALLALTAGLLLCFPAAAGAQQARIINGTPSPAWPAQTSVYHEPSNRVCGGTLISARWVLTAGHCVTFGGSVLPANGFRLHIGGVSRGFGPPIEPMITPDLVVRHPGYDSPTTAPPYDVALLRLPAPAPQEPLAIVGAAPRDTEFWTPGTRATILGWGATQTRDRSEDQLIRAEVPMITDADCARAWSTPFKPASMVCAGNEFSDTCGGDSGGPLMVPRLGAYALVGVTSWGSDQCGQSNYPSPANPIKPGVYARIGDGVISDWIRSWVPTLSLSTSPAAPISGQEFTLGAALSAGGASGIVWDTNGDEVFGDAAGPEINLTVPSAGTYIVQAKATEGDRTAIARERIVVSDPPPPPPPLPPPPTPPPSPQPQVPAPRTVANGVGVTSRMKLVTLRTKGVRVRYECERACAIRGRLSLGPVSARRFGLGRRGTSVPIGSGTARLPQSGTGTLTLKLTKRAKLALRNRERVTISVVTNLTAGSVTVPGKHPVSVRR